MRMAGATLVLTVLMEMAKVASMVEVGVMAETEVPQATTATGMAMARGMEAETKMVVVPATMAVVETEALPAGMEMPLMEVEVKGAVPAVGLAAEMLYRRHGIPCCST